MKKLALCLLTLTTPFIHAQTWQSSIVQMDANGYLNYVEDNEKNRIPDFSFAGYQRGEQAIPYVETVLEISPISGDNSQHIQDAVDQVAAMPLVNGFRGALLLKAGTYSCGTTIEVNASGIVLRGEGQGDDPANSTIIYSTGTEQKNVLEAGGSNPYNYWKSKIGSNVNITQDFVQVGSHTFTVADASSFSVGDNIVVYHPCTQAWIDALDGGGAPTEADWEVDKFPIVFNRYITGISGNNITVDVPIYNHLDKSLSQSYIYKFNNSNILRNIGVENLRVSIEHVSDEDENHAKNGIVFNELEDAWALDCTSEHFILAGFQTQSATRVTVERCSAINPICQVEPSRRYNFNCATGSNQILFKDCYANYGRHAFVSNGVTWVSGVVIYNCESEHPYTSSEGHRHWTTGMLFDNYRDHGDNPGNRVLGLYNRGDYGSSHGWSNAHSVAWNCDLRRTNSNNDGQMVCQKPPTAQNYAIGCFGDITGDGPFDGPEGFIEGSNTAGLEPASLYAAQLACRLGNDIPLECNGIYASDDDGNVAENTLDNDLDTRWSADGDSAFIEFCFDWDSIAISGTELAFFRGDERQTYFDIYGTTDGNQWFEILSDQSSSGTTLTGETFEFPSTVWVKRLRYVGRGNSQNTWNSITEWSWDTVHVAFNNTPHAIPGIIGLEDYNLGGQGYGYYDTSAGNEGEPYRSDDVDIDDASVYNYTIGWTAVGEWLNYTVDISEAGFYDFNLTFAAKNADSEVAFYLDGEHLGNLDLPLTGDYQSYDVAVLNGLDLPAGEHVIKVELVKAGVNLNRLEVLNSIITETPESALQQFAVYPQPANDVLRIVQPINNGASFQLYDPIGRMVQQLQLNTAQGSMNVSGLPAGTYFLSNGTSTQRVVIVR